MSSMTIEEIQAYLPHRYPFLLIDRVLTVNINESLHAFKNVTINEHFFNGHFPDIPVMPGVLIIEALAQAAGILTLKTLDTVGNKDNQFFLAGIDKARFKRQVIPGDQLHLHINLIKNKQNLWFFKGEARVDEQLVCTAEILNAKAINR